MKRVMIALALAMAMVAGVATAGTQYHVYKKKGSSKCEVDSRDHKKWRNARGSGWKCLGHFNYRMDAEKLFKKAGCKR